MKLLKIALLCVAISLGFFAQDLLQAAKSGSDTDTYDKDKYCLLSQTECLQDQVTMKLDRDILKPLTESLITVEWPDNKSDTLSLNLQGLEMDMGTARYQLTRQENGLYSAAIMLPVCMQDKMTWLGELSDGTTTVYPAIRMER